MSTLTTTRPAPVRRELLGKSIREKAALLFPATEIIINADGTATVSSPVSGTEYHIDANGNCSCPASRPCWHMVALGLYITRRAANVFATAVNAPIPAFDSQPVEIPAGCHTISLRGVLLCPFCGNGRQDGWYATTCDYCNEWAASTATTGTETL